ncbi:hypothetical protein [Gluconobacter cerinus]|uniref:hypothetical protein n=1 Tax=Gluconobacter cerinus TaxID=38307 RepID=UPI001B8CF675|nr:hypothetical protein [Gluconobacter cerinus]MBS0982169.1 hypothetical protein [Gluconobacter cerinus]
MKYTAVLTDYDIKPSHGSYSVKVELSLGLTNVSDIFLGINSGEMMCDSTLRFEVNLKNIPATTEEDLAAWAVRFLRDRLSDTESKSLFGAQ